MAAPVLTAPALKAGAPVIDPHATKIIFASAPGAPLWIKAITPFGLEGGEAIDTGNMDNLAVTTKAPQSIIDITNASMRVAYDPELIATYMDLINEEDSITVLWSNGAAMAVWGYLKSLIFDEMVKSQEAQQPTAMATLVATNRDPVTGEEEPPITGII